MRNASSLQGENERQWRKKVNKKRLTNWRGWVDSGSCVAGRALRVVRRGSCVVGRASWVVGRASWVVCRALVPRASCVVRRGSCVIAPASSRRLLLVEFKGAVFLYTTLRIHEKVFPIKFSKANLSAKYFLPCPVPFSRMLLAHSLVPSRPRWI